MESTADDLIVSHIDRVRRLARAVCRRVSNDIDLEELISAGFVGLVQAARTFDTSQRVQFWTWAGWRVYGAMMDYARQMRGRRVSVGRNGKKLGPSARARVAWLPLEDLNADDEPAVESDIIDAIEYREQLTRIAAALPHCTDVQQSIIARRLRDEETRDIARELGMKQLAIDYQRKQATKKIKNIISMEETTCLTRLSAYKNHHSMT